MPSSTVGDAIGRRYRRLKRSSVSHKPPTMEGIRSISSSPILQDKGFRNLSIGLFFTPFLFISVFVVFVVLIFFVVKDWVSGMVYGRSRISPTRYEKHHSLSYLRGCRLDCPGESRGEIVARLKRDLLPTMINGLLYWPICDFLTFKFIPVHLQPLINGSFSYVWTIYLTYMANLKKACND
ncbi:hypothetical protein L1049_026537 [Liquidambar formosana]|uniref:Uncharacterized protein n=1 Tax=Liquidambar formosana TaxID=63359 RepID=A0AAP0NH71_LIQFO